MNNCRNKTEEFIYQRIYCLAKSDETFDVDSHIRITT